jgi:hypothetical protein
MSRLTRSRRGGASRLVPWVPRALGPTPLTRLAVRCRRAVARHRWLRRLLVVGAAVAVASTTFSRLERVDAARARWGDTLEVLVATAGSDAGEPLRVEVRSLPAAMVPAGSVAADRVDDPLVARQRVTVGEVVVDADVTVDGPLGLVPDGWLAVPVVESPPSGAAAGERVQVASEGVVIAAEALVVGHQGDATLIAVPADAAPLLPVAATDGTLAVLRSPGV